MISFYGGKQGRPFQIKKVFTSKYNKKDQASDSTQDSMQNDLLSPASSVGIGDYVLISYGLPSDKTYNTNKQIDLDAVEENKRTYNGTLWQKVDKENKFLNSNLEDLEQYTVKGSKFAYIFLESFTGNTPIFTASASAQPADSDPNASIVDSDSSIDFPELIFELPKSWDFKSTVDKETLNPGTTPQIKVLDKNETNLDSDVTKNWNKSIKTLYFKMPTTPEFQTGVGIDNTIKSDGTPKASINKDDPKNYKLNLKIPKPWNFNNNIGISLGDPKSSPTGSIETDSSNSSDPVKKISLNLPGPWDFQETVSINTIELPANSTEGQLAVTEVSVEGSNKKKLGISLPRNWDFTAVIDNKSLNANANAEVALEPDKADEANKKQFKFKLPQSQILDTEVGVNHIGPTELPSASLSNENINKPKINLNLPKAAKFYFGELVTGNTQQTKIINKSLGYEIGDYYINQTTGFIYYINAIENIPDNQLQVKITFDFIASLAAKPGVSVTPVSPYNTSNPNDIKTVGPSVGAPSYDSETGNINYPFSMPKIPLISATADFIGSNDSLKREVDKTITADEVTFNFKTPRGVKWFTGSLVNHKNLNVHIDGALNGDYYLYVTENQYDEDRGHIYQFNGSSWIDRGSLEGPVGDSVHIINDLTYTDQNYTKDGIISKLDIEYPDKSALKKDDVIAVTYKDENNLLVSYWYYWINNKWGRSLLTSSSPGIEWGNISSLF